jgi:hypothetical protein
MPVALRPDPCWIGLWQGPGIRNDIDSCPHYGTAVGVPSFDEHPGRACRHLGCGGVVTFGLAGGFCGWCEAEGLTGAEWESRDYLPGQLPVPCLEVTCDGRCGQVLAGDGDVAYCFASVAEARRAAARHGWLAGDGRAWCADDLPPGADPRPPASGAELEAAGQLRLPGC